ncbi:ABC transporter substrate-binding protein [Auraticoccus cholistanensis]|nr:extracellular solute-binding protein [Auraticoccus cholistanensis]
MTTSVGLGLAGCGSGGGADGRPLAVTWWGNDVRNSLTTEAIDTFAASRPGTTFAPQPGEWSSYWNRLATQVAGGDAPDVIQMDEAYLSEYASRGALLDLAGKVDTSRFLAGTAESGAVQDITAGVSIGVNALAFVVNPAVFEDAGVELPDDTTWTWEEFRATAAEVSAKSPDGSVGAAGMFTNPKLMQVWLRQQGTELFLTDGRPGYDAGLVDEYLQLMMSFREEGAIPEPSVLVEDAAAALDQSLMAQGRAAIGFYGSNQLTALTRASGAPLQLVRWPSTTGRAADRQAWYKSASLWSVSARSRQPELAAEFVDWWVNDPACTRIVLNERGAPANTDRAADIEAELDETGAAVAAFLAQNEADLGAAPPLPPPGGASADATLTRVATDVLFERSSTSQAAAAFVAEVDAALT